MQCRDQVTLQVPCGWSWLFSSHRLEHGRFPTPYRPTHWGMCPYIETISWILYYLDIGAIKSTGWVVCISTVVWLYVDVPTFHNFTCSVRDANYRNLSISTISVFAAIGYILFAWIAAAISVAISSIAVSTAVRWECSSNDTSLYMPCTSSYVLLFV